MSSEPTSEPTKEPIKEPTKEPTTTKKEKKKSSSWDSVESIACIIGEWAWIILLIEGIIFIFWGLWGLLWVGAGAVAAQQAGVAEYVAADLTWETFIYILDIIGGIVTIIVAVVLVRPRFSNKWKEKDYDYLLDDVIEIGSVRIPTFLIIGIVIEILTNFWGGVVILIPLLLLIFMGPKEYNWKAE
ncbi:MAG: hypothetical protein EU540_01035 [Promethearchaeota archaeon]|nr:MAG: hypothetical protein EU540_01035 [Candidatus Lokiarchaeota archaeon]